MATFVLVPGGWQGGWVWRRLAPLLRAGGHDVYSLTLTGLGERVHLARPEVGLDTHICDVVNVLDYEELRDVVLVGHSYGGAVITGVADRVPEQLAQLVYLDTAPLTDGAALLDSAPPPLRDRTIARANELGDGWRWPMPSNEEVGQVASLAGLDDETIVWMRSKSTPQPLRTFTEPIHLTRGADPGVPRAMILGTDGGPSLEQLEALIASGNPAYAALAAPDWRFLTLHTGHWSMLTRPDELATLLSSLLTTPR